MDGGAGVYVVLWSVVGHSKQREIHGCVLQIYRVLGVRGGSRSRGIVGACIFQLVERRWSFHLLEINNLASRALDASFSSAGAGMGHPVVLDGNIENGPVAE